jgi:predicted acyl esterase
MFKALQLLVVFAVFSACIARCLYPEELTGRESRSTRVDFFFTLTDGTKLDCTKFYPDGSPPQGGWPCIIICHGYGLTKYDEMDWAESFADEEIYSLVYSMRGQGASTGYSNLISTTEMYDLMQVIQYVKNDQNTNDNRIGVIGASQGGILPFMAACNGASIRCIASDFTTPDFASSWIENGSIKMTLLWTASYAQNIVRYNSTVGRFRSWILSSQRDKWDSLAHLLPMNRDFMNRVNSCQVPVLASNAWQDKFFNTAGMINAVPLLQVPFRAYWGALDGHGSDESDPEFEFQSELLSDWLDYWLKNVQNGVLNPLYKFTYASTRFPRNYNWWTFQRFSSPIWPPSGISNVRLYFHPANALLLEQYTGSQTSVSFLNDVRDPNLTMETAVNYEFTGEVFESKFVKTTLDFTTPTLLQDSRLVGVPKINLFYSSDADLCQYNFQIWEVRPNNDMKLVTRANWTDRYYTTNSVKQKLINGIAHSHIFRQGNRIRITVTNLDNHDDDEFLRTNPHVLPVLKRASNKIYVNYASRSYIELPMIGFAIGVKNISSEVPAKFNLYQNYPNPFNPVTKMKFDIPLTPQSPLEGGIRGVREGLVDDSKSRQTRGAVRLIIYDALGREAATLVNEPLSPGSYEVEFDGSNLPSGVYFYRVTSGEYSDTKKMIMVK